MSMLASFLLLYVSFEMEGLPLLHFNLLVKCCNLLPLFVLSVICIPAYCGACEHPFICGGRWFEYPFGKGHSGCGDPLLQLQCDEKWPLLEIEDTQYYILDFSTFNFSEGIEMTIIDKSLMEEQCSPSSNNSMQFWSDDHLHIVDGKNITLWKGCQVDLPDSPSNVFALGCDNSFYNITSSNKIWTTNCTSHFQLPARKDLDPLSLGPNPMEIFKFKIKWMPTSDCRDCMFKNGSCAYNAANQFFCIPHDKPRGGNSNNFLLRGVVAGIGISLIVAVLLLYAFGKRAFFSASRASSSASKVEKFLQDFTNEMPTRYSYSQLKKITNNFADKLGEGGFGIVYRGKLSNGNLVAVKILDQSRQSESQFMNEVATIGRIHHVHLVHLMGYCFERFRSALVYEYMANGSLEKFVFAKKGKPQMLSWEQLYSIALGAARGIAYLHQDCERRIIHFDIKPHNILLDADFTPKVSDFGLAKLCRRLDDHMSITAARGTPGYAAPELWSRNLGPITDKADVYSFGMMLLEIVGRRKNIDVQVSRSSEVYFPDWAFKLLEKGELEERLRGRIGEEMGCENDAQVLRLCKIGTWCIQYKSRDRPTMSRVVQMLEGIGDEVSNPPFPFNSASASAYPERLLTSSTEESSSV